MGFCKSKLARLILPRRIFDFFDTIGRKKTFSAVRHPLSAGPKGIRIPGFSTAGALCALDLLDAPRLAGLSWRRARPLDQFQPRRPLATARWRSNAVAARLFGEIRLVKSRTRPKERGGPTIGERNPGSAITAD
jgi:hypothetical protein